MRFITDELRNKIFTKKDIINGHRIITKFAWLPIKAHSQHEIRWLEKAGFSHECE